MLATASNNVKSTENAFQTNKVEQKNLLFEKKTKNKLHKEQMLSYFDYLHWLDQQDKL
jgi:hypothetical protein